MFRCSNVLLLLFVLVGCKNSAEVSSKEDILRKPKVTERIIYDNIVFYDSYAKPTDSAVPRNVIRINNSRYAKKLTVDDLNAISDKLTLEIIVHARCDNYDRIGSVYLSFVEKGKRLGADTLVKTQEIARFITPFMDKNKEPKTVPYTFQMDNVARLLHNKALNESHDLWLEFEIFGVPYAANKQVDGCEGRNDVFGGTLKLISTNEAYANTDEAYIRMYSKELINNYDNTDVPSQTTKTSQFSIDKPIKEAKLYVITSNHGANKGGEEYIRRAHFIYFDGALVSQYTPGGLSCEPFRKYNTQPNGIYGKKPMEEAQWADWNNWCPGNKIPIRVFDLGDLATGSHRFKIDVPEAEFKGQEGHIPLTAYIQGRY